MLNENRKAQADEVMHSIYGHIFQCCLYSVILRCDQNTRTDSLNPCFVCVLKCETIVT